MNISLIGYRGSGKTSVGRALAERFALRFVDTDVEIERRAGCSIAEIFARQGEPAFRTIEKQVVADTAAGDGLVIACGGGVVLDPANVAALKRAGKVVWLRCPAEELHRRITTDPATGRTRPNLTALGGLAEVRKLLEVRTPLYTAAAEVTMDVEGRSVEEIVAAMMDQLS